MKIPTFLKFLFSGGIAASTTFILLYFFTHILGIWYLVSSIIAFSLAIIVNFCLQKFWTFNESQLKKWHRQFFLFLTINLINLLLNSLGMYLLVDKVHLWYMLAQFIMSGILAIISFIFYSFIFKNEAKFDIY